MSKENGNRTDLSNILHIQSRTTGDMGHAISNTLIYFSLFLLFTELFEKIYVSSGINNRQFDWNGMVEMVQMASIYIQPYSTNDKQIVRC